MAAFVHSTDPLLVYANGNAIYGEDWLDNRSTFHPIAEIVCDAGGLAGTTQWYQDRGPIGMAESRKEPRNFCSRGGCHFSFTGRILILRLNVAFSWFTGSVVKIDGVPPSTIPGLLTAKDVVSCDSVTYGLFSDSYVDVIVADGLSNAAHTCSITIDSANPAKFFSIAGFKVASLTAQDLLLVSPQWLYGAEIEPNRVNVRLQNRQAGAVYDVAVTYPSSVHATSLMSWAKIGAAAQVDSPFYGLHTGGEAEGAISYPVTLAASYPDPAGSITKVDTVVLQARSSQITFLPSPWYGDDLGPGGAPRNYCDAQLQGGVPWCLRFDFEGDTLNITASCSSGWGVMGLYDGPTIGATLLGTVDCGLNEAEAAHVFTFSGFGAGSHTMWLRKRDADPLVIVFLEASWTATIKLTRVVETFRVQAVGKQPIPLLPQSVTLNADGYDYSCAAPDPAARQLDFSPVRSNAGVVKTETLQRFPTFAVFYGTGYRELLAEYDVLILDPIGADVDDVLYWQSQGIKCYGYIASMEEVGFYQDRYDFASPLAPRMDGTGPGGYSSNYMFTKQPVNGPPDRNGAWASFYMDPRDGSGWKERIIDYYLPQVFGGEEIVVEEPVVLIAHTIAAGARLVFPTATSPINGNRPITLTTSDHSHTYVTYQDYTFDVKTGSFVMSPTVDPPVTVGQTLLISYTRKGHNMDGLFWDVVDDVDVYLSSDWGFEYVPGHAEGAVGMINEVNLINPDKGHISNRGFTILPQIIHTCDGVMFESWLTLPTTAGPWTPATEYYIVADEPTIDFNTMWNDQMRELRTKHVFDVYSLNYARNTPADDHLREYCKRVDAEYGYLSWVTVILLNDPTHNAAITVPDPRVQTSEFQVLKHRGY